MKKIEKRYNKEEIKKMYDEETNIKEMCIISALEEINEEEKEVNFITALETETEYIIVLEEIK